MICKGEPPQLVDDEDELPQLIASMLVKIQRKDHHERTQRHVQGVFEHHEEGGKNTDVTLRKKR